MTQDLICRLFCHHVDYVVSGYGFVGIIRQAAHVYFCLNQALITLNIKNNMYMNKQIKQFGLY